MTRITDLSKEAQEIMNEIIVVTEDFKRKGIIMGELSELIDLMNYAKKGVPNMGGITHLELPKILTIIGDKTISPMEYVEASVDEDLAENLLNKARCIVKFNDIRERWFKLYGTGSV